MQIPTAGWDQSWGFLNPQQAVQHGLGLVAGYLSHTPSKNLTVDDVHAYHRAGIGVLLLWEDQSGEALGGDVKGAAAGAEAKRQANALFAAVGYRPANVPSIVAAVDFDAQPNQYAQIDGYFRGFGRSLAPGFRCGCYGSAHLVQHLADAKLTSVEFQTIAWSYGVVAAATDMLQDVVNTTIAGVSVDHDRIIHPRQLGAWWPKGHPLNVAATAPVVPPHPAPAPAPHPAPAPVAHDPLSPAARDAIAGMVNNALGTHCDGKTHGRWTGRESWAGKHKKGLL